MKTNPHLRGVYLLALTLLCASTKAQDLGTIHIYRDPTLIGSAINPRVYADGKPLVDIASARHYAGSFAPGLHVLHLDDKRSGVQIDVRAGAHYYLRIEVVPGFFVGSGRLTMILPEQGSYESNQLQNTERADVLNDAIPLGYSVDRLAWMAENELASIAYSLLEGGKFPRRLDGQKFGGALNNPRLLDPWGTPYLYRLNPDGSGFVLASAGADRSFDEASWSVRGQHDDLRGDCVVIGDRKQAEFVRRWTTDGGSQDSADTRR